MGSEVPVLLSGASRGCCVLRWGPRGSVSLLSQWPCPLWAQMNLTFILTQGLWGLWLSWLLTELHPSCGLVASAPLHRCGYSHPQQQPPRLAQCSPRMIPGRAGVGRIGLWAPGLTKLALDTTPAPHGAAGLAVEMSSGQLREEEEGARPRARCCGRGRKKGGQGTRTKELGVQGTSGGWAWGR